MVSSATTSDLNYDPYSMETGYDPHALFRRLRDEAPLYRNDEHDFWALSRFEDVERAHIDPDTFISRKGVTLAPPQGRRRVPPGHGDHGGPADPHDPPAVALADVHRAEGVGRSSR